MGFVSDLLSAALFAHAGAGMLAFVVFVGALSLGLAVLPSRLGPPWLRALGGVPLFLIVGTTAGLIAYLVGGSAFWALLVLVVCALGAVLWALRHGCLPALWNPRQLATLGMLLFVGFVVMFFGWGETQDGTVRSTSGAWGDGALHTLNAEAFALRTDGSLSFPAFAGEFFREPFGYDFLAGILRSAGFTIGGAFTLPAAALLACLVGWSAALAQCISRPSPGIALALTAALVLFGSGLQWVVMAQRTASWHPARFFGVHDPPWDKVEELGLIWANHINTFVSQKHFLLAAAFLAVLAAVFLQTLQNTVADTPMRRTLLLAAMATGFLQFFHAHGFLAAMLLWVGAFLVRWSRPLLALGGLAALLALPFFLWYAGAVGRPGFLGFAPGYLAPPNLGGWALFWFVNLGLFLPLALVALLRAPRHVRWLFGFPAGGLFLLGNLIRFQPYLWDNHKLFLFAWLLLLPLVMALLIEWVVPGGRVRVLRVVSVSVLVIVMSLTTLSETATYVAFRSSHPVYTAVHRAEAEELRALLPPDAVVLAATNVVHNHPLTLTGRTLVSGYGGWIWTRGIPWEERSAQMHRALTADTVDRFCGAVSALSATHVVVGDQERQWLGPVTPRAETFLESLPLPSPGFPRVGDVARICGAALEFSLRSNIL